MPHMIELFVVEHCPGCPDARVRVREFAESRHNVVVVERNIEHHLDLTRRYGLFATPAVVIDGRNVLYGVPIFAQLAARCDGLTASPTT